MEKPYDVTIRMDLGNDMVRAWYERLMTGAMHPMYQGKIRIEEPVPVNEVQDA